MFKSEAIPFAFLFLIASITEMGPIGCPHEDERPSPGTHVA